MYRYSLVFPRFSTQPSSKLAMSSTTAAPRVPPARVADARRRATATSSTSRAPDSSILARANGRDVVRLVPKASPLDDAPSPHGAMGASRARSATSSTRRRTSSSRGDRVTTRAERETRLVSVLTSLPRRFNLYFQRKSYRLTLWRAISAYFGFYLANVMTLSFGALGINDVVAGALSVAFFEVVTRIYYRSVETNRWLEFINWFKVGYCYSLIADAFKLGS
tara:strand:+ start:699 stop:1364 length:666 start_codon:yes stop_codon:yes gene_type:complete